MDARFEGNVKFFNEAKGFGFIVTQGSEDMFMHITEVESGFIPQVGDRVSYYPGQGKKGMVATDIHLVKKADKDDQDKMRAENNKRNTKQPYTSHTKERENGQTGIPRIFGSCYELPMLPV